MSSPTDIESVKLLLGEVNSLGSLLLEGDGNESARKALIIAAEKLVIAARTPGENLYLTAAQPFLNGSIGAAYSIGIFDCIPSDINEDVSAEEISLKTGAEEALVVRIMRVLTSSHIWVETGPRRYASNHFSRILGTPANRAHFQIQNTIVGPAAGKLGAYLETHNLRSPTDHHDTPLQYALKTPHDLWGYLKEEPSRAKMFNESMRSSAIVGAAGVPPFPFATELKCKSEDEVVIVDVGGGKGQALESIRKSFPELKGRMVVQDLPEVTKDTIESAHLPPSIETMPIDFFKPQPIHGAKAYFMRRIMHDWGDEDCKTILRNIVPSMSVDSKILINELVLPDYACERRMALNDLVMMSFGGMERTESQWTALLQGAGLQMRNIWRKPGENLSVIEAMLSE
ncbi:S-adenosyl-L-methionine-dependent methyltransferase [Hyaloscypha variabilis F]|uniref:S-adenosyl-L-methionine-dependent methyltransferase n=1 Tax=Hyaloscypha variabilis (strain UAMH 11265 / GT02V1 / F) TaxID=1149755 RepID=A0A2J6RBA0_HYAVF|nr:S-adenosyl-L-methionine-dependent methyltransferase [Hyaloscypha variabilis F]